MTAYDRSLEPVVATNDASEASSPDSFDKVSTLFYSPAHVREVWQPQPSSANNLTNNHPLAAHGMERDQAKETEREKKVTTSVHIPSGQRTNWTSFLIHLTNEQDKTHMDLYALPKELYHRLETEWKKLEGKGKESKGAPRKRWTEEEDSQLRLAVEQRSGKNWTTIAATVLPHRTEKACRVRWRYLSEQSKTRTGSSHEAPPVNTPDVQDNKVTPI
eukprot:scaffold5939_cov165-Ochromonas_danica.AAC.6